jgi:putative transferase (TIGR04331 family)
MSANISRFFEGYRNSYLSGGQNLKYFYDQVLFFKKLKLNVIKDVLIRTRFNNKDPNDYMSFLRKQFNKIKIEDLKGTAFNRLNQKDIKIIIVDHCSTPWLEALFVNKPLIIFWDKNINKISNKFSHIFKELRQNKILFNNPHEAANRLNEISNLSTDWWYSKKIQKLREKILILFFSYDKSSINMWNKKLRRLILS